MDFMLIDYMGPFDVTTAYPTYEQNRRGLGESTVEDTVWLYRAAVTLLHSSTTACLSCDFSSDMGTYGITAMPPY
jgi:hypothetical protein